MGVPGYHIGLYRIIIFLCLGWTPFYAFSGHTTNVSALPDTVRVKGGNYLFFQDHILFIPRDTVLVLPANSQFIIKKDVYTKSTSLYDSLQSKASQRTWSRLLHKALFVEPLRTTDTRQQRKSEDDYLVHEGKIIRNIKLIATDIFGPTALDTTVTSATWIGSTLNKLHFYTNEKIIRNNILFEEGGTIDPQVLADNERVLRRLKFIYDARIQVIPVSEGWVDVYVITKDLYSLGLNIAFEGIEPTKIELYERNLFGTGHEIHGNLSFDYEPASFADYDTVSPLGFEAFYRIPNIRGTFIQSEISYMNGEHHKFVGGSFSRKFITPRTKYAGGISISLQSKLIKTDTIGWFKGNYQDYWLGRSFLVDPENRSRVILAARYINNNVFEKTKITSNIYHDLQDYRLFLGSIAFSRQNFYETNLIYNYGRIEDIPYGSLVEVTGGLEKNEFGDRFYTSLHISAGNYLERFGYLQSSFAIGGFVSSGAYKQGMIQAKANYFTNLFSLRKYNFRQFVKLDYTIGIRPYLDEEISISNTKGIQGLSGEGLKGTHRLSLNLESVAFTPIFVYGFRFTFYGFADLALIGAYNKNILNNHLYSGLGFGVRIRNENLVFKTFQIRLAFYPDLPGIYSPSMFSISDEKLLNQQNFNFIAPEPLKFR